MCENARFMRRGYFCGNPPSHGGERSNVKDAEELRSFPRVAYNPYAADQSDDPSVYFAVRAGIWEHLQKCSQSFGTKCAFFRSVIPRESNPLFPEGSRLMALSDTFTA